jgi:uncharacterized protein (UPF0332 family)
MKQNIAPKRHKIVRKQINGKFNNTGSVDENKHIIFITAAISSSVIS